MLSDTGHDAAISTSRDLREREALELSGVLNKRLKETLLLYPIPAGERGGRVSLSGLAKSVFVKGKGKKEKERVMVFMGHADSVKKKTSWLMMNYDIRLCNCNLQYVK